MPGTADAPRRRHPDVEAYLARQPLPARALARALRALVMDDAPDARERLWYGVPFFTIDGHGVCYVSVARKHITLGFPEGAHLPRRAGLEGTGKTPIRKATLPLDGGIPPQAPAWIEDAIAHARASPPCEPASSATKRARRAE